MNISRLIPAPPVIRLFVFVGMVWAAVVGPISTIIILSYMGATNPQLGMFSAAAALISVFCQPGWGYLADKLKSPRKVLCSCLASSAFFFALVLFTDNLYIAIVFLLLDVVFRCCVISLLDSHTLQEVAVIPGLQYSHIRLAGSVFFGFTSFMFSIAMDNHGVMVIIPISFSIAMVTVLWGFFAAKGRYEAPREQASGTKAVKGNIKKDAITLLKQKWFMIFILFGALSAMAMQPTFVFMIEFVYQVGGTPGQVPLIHALRCVVEVPVFILVGIFGKRIPTKTLLIIAICFNFIFVIGLVFSTSFIMLTISHLFGATIGFIFNLTGRLRYINENSPESVRSTSITVMSTFDIGLAAIIGNLVAGFILGMFSTRILSVFLLAPLILSAVLLIFLPKKPI